MRHVPSAKHWSALFEFDIPRRAKRPDLILLACDLIFVLEFKFGAVDFGGDAEWQATSYALDLRDFHVGSFGRRIIPVLIASHAVSQTSAPLRDFANDGRSVLPLTKIGDYLGVATAALVCTAFERLHDADSDPIEAGAWDSSPYRPTPTIIEAAQTLFAGHGVREISHAFATNLSETSGELIRAIEAAQRANERVICFVTGLPGAGKTLAGLNAVHDPSVRMQGRPAAVFLSGNGPLVKIVRAALTRDQQQSGKNRKEASRTVATFIDNVHRFVTTYGLEKLDEPPYESAIVFDEAQRAWNAAAVRKKHEVDRSEPALVLDIMERAPKWAAIIALVGGGQEIHFGEGGLEEWGRALNARTVPWKVLASPEVISGGEAVAGHQLIVGDINPLLSLVPIDSLHLATNVRAPRARLLGTWVNSLLFPQDRTDAEASIGDEYPIALTRDLDVARQWLRSHSDGAQRAGLLASSGALRLRHHGIEVSSGFRQGYAFEDWFLAPLDDVRASNWLEVAATEFECQGLELDWTGVCWSGDVVVKPGSASWLCRRFRGNKWMHVRKEDDIRYALNKYRVLLTRARKGMVIWVPRGDRNDPSREPDLLDATADFLQVRGVAMI